LRQRQAKVDSNGTMLYLMGSLGSMVAIGCHWFFHDF